MSAVFRASIVVAATCAACSNGPGPDASTSGSSSNSPPEPSELGTASAAPEDERLVAPRNLQEATARYNRLTDVDMASKKYAAIEPVYRNGKKELLAWAQERLVWLDVDPAEITDETTVVGALATVDGLRGKT